MDMEVDRAQVEPRIEATLLLLAGGSSRRMGRPKQVLPFAGTTLIEWQVSRLRGAFAETLIAVASPDQLPEALQSLAVLDDPSGRGPLGGLRAGLAAAAWPVVFALACDVPSLSATQAEQLAKQLAPHVDAVVPRSPRGPEPLAAAYRRDPTRQAAEAALAAGELRLSDLLGRLEVVYRDLPALTNLNAPSDYEAFLDN